MKNIEHPFIIKLKQTIKTPSKIHFIMPYLGTLIIKRIWRFILELKIKNYIQLIRN